MKQLVPYLFLIFLTGTFTSTQAQPDYKKQGRCKDEDIPRYTAHKISGAPVIDGKLDEASWKNAVRSKPFTDLISGAATHLNTQAAVLWDDQNLYVAYWVEEPDVAATLTERDAPIYQDNDVELFIAGEDGYYEFEINSFGTIYEVLFFWMDAFEKKAYHLRKEFDKKAKGVKPFNGVAYKHPRGRRIGFWNWDMPGLRSAVQVEGTINNNKDTDKGWTVEIAIPWSSLKIIAEGDGRAHPPKEGDTWRMDFSRFNVKKGNANDSGGWAWSSHGVWDSHVPECFTYIKFSTQASPK